MQVSKGKNKFNSHAFGAAVTVNLSDFLDKTFIFKSSTCFNHEHLNITGTPKTLISINFTL